jgi:hypothetical protein
MQTGHVFLCDHSSMTDCLRNKRFACADEQANVVRELKINSLLFLLSEKTGILLGPFTVAQEPENLIKGAWFSSVEKNQISENIKVEWESLHEPKNATETIPFLRNIKSCTLSPLQTQELITKLERAPLYNSKQTHVTATKNRGKKN